MADVTVYGFPLSTYVRTARCALEEKGVTYGLEPSEPHSEEIKALNPLGKIPAFRHGELTLFETAAIVRYVDEVFDGPPLQPPDPASRALMEQWISAYNDSMYPKMVTVLIQRLVAPMRGGTPDEDLIASVVPDIEHHLDILDDVLGRQAWLAGDAFSSADLFLAPMIYYLRMLPEGERLLPGLSHLGRWYEAVEGRASFRATTPSLPE